MKNIDIKLLNLSNECKNKNTENIYIFFKNK